jgi:hypothetical protein
MESIKPCEPQLSTSIISEANQLPMRDEASSLACPLSLLTGSSRTPFSSNPHISNAAATTRKLPQAALNFVLAKLSI